MEEECFSESGVTCVEIPSRVKEIKQDAFSGCCALRGVSFAKETQLRTIGKHAFARSGLSSFVAPASLREIGRGAFWSCRALRRAELNEGLAVLGTNVLARDKETEHGAFEDCALEQVSLSTTLERIQFRAFAKCDRLVAITLP